MPRRHSTSLTVCAIASVAASVSLGLIAPGTDLASGGIALIGIAVAVTAAIANATTARHTRDRARLAWALVAVAQTIVVVSGLSALGVSAAGVVIPEVSLLDAGYFASYLSVFGAAWVLYSRMRPERGWQGMIDAIVITLAVGAFAWRFCVGARAEDVSGGVTGAVVNLAYPLLDLGLLLIVSWLVGRLGHEAPSWLWMLTAGLALQLSGDVAYLVAALADDVLLASLAPSAHIAAGWMWFVAARRRRTVSKRVWAPIQRSAPPAWAGAIPFIFGAGMFVPLIPADPLLGSAALAGSAFGCWRVIDNLRAAGTMISDHEQLLLSDPLTGAYNRRYFEQEMARAVARSARERRVFSLIAFDLDRFKEVNDREGHLVGDELLVAVVGASQGSLRSQDMLFRLGGDEFAVIADGADADEAAVLAERIRVAVRGAGADVCPSANVSASLGVACCPADGTDPLTLMGLADDALYAAKAAGRDAVSRAPGQLAGA